MTKGNLSQCRILKHVIFKTNNLLFFSYNISLKDMHDRMHSNEENFMCMQCNRKFTDAEHLDLHLRAHNDARVVRFSL